ncbi:MAG: WYL domain-containing protein [Candidatus Thiodiazotropha sp. (ex Epidulcina cf. delphinae)]|nr:WYL domain-containing protein [Candidatus Thiodiazotropha sp. (ex Epidulcina cf. delphinae)]
MDSKKHRQYRLHRLLKTRRYPISIAELCRILDTSNKTIYRDIQEFRDLYQAPLESNEQGYYYNQTTADSFELPGIWFSDAELQALPAARQLLSRIQPGVLEEQITPLTQFITNTLSRHGHPADNALQRVRILGIGQRSSNQQHFIKAAQALLDRQQLAITYTNRNSQRHSRRTISPQRLTHYRDNWYLDAWCHNREALRTFSLHNIQQINVTAEIAIEIPEQQLEAQLESAFGIFSGKADKTAILHFNQQRAHYIEKEQWHPTQQGQWMDDKYQLSIPYHNPTELIMDILKYGADVEVIEPAGLKQAVKEEIRKMAKQYE